MRSLFRGLEKQATIRTGSQPASQAGASADLPQHAVQRHLAGTAGGLRPEQTLALQRAIGNRALARALAPATAPAAREGAFVAPPQVETQLESERGRGRPLPAATRQFMEPRFGANFGAVKIHNDPRADTLSRSVQARAFTHGSDLYFRRGEYDPGSPRGQHRLAHELTHVVQQTGAVKRQIQRAGEEVGKVSSPFLEAQEAEKARLEENRAKSPFDRAKAERDVQELYRRVAKYPPLDTAEFKGLFPRYIEAMATYDQIAAHALINKMVGYLDARKAFTIDKRTYRSTQDASGGVTPEMKSASATGAQNVQLWSKINRHFPIEKAAEEGALTLEFTAAGKLFDGLDFGAQFANSVALQQQWKRVSQSYVSKARGIVHARVFLGITPFSVLTTTEWPIIKRRIEQGLVERLEIHFYDAPSNVPVETGSAIVRTQADWDALPKYTDFPDFAERQNRLQGSENARAAEKKAAKQGAKPEAQKIDESAVPFAAEKAVLEPLDE